MGDIGLCSWLSPSHLPKYPPLHDAHGQGQVRPDLSFERQARKSPIQFRGRGGPRALIRPGNGEGIPDFRCGRNREPGNFPIPHSARSGNRGPRGGGPGISCPWSAVTLHRDRDGSLLKPRRPPTSESGLGSPLARLLPNPDAARVTRGGKRTQPFGAPSRCFGYFYKGHARANGHL
jgi:hypothetical protein